MNVIDWVAMGFKFNDTAKEYYEKNKHEINLPDWAIKLMYEIFDCIYTSDGKIQNIRGGMQKERKLRDIEAKKYKI